jgi:hypothetical protein
MILIINPAIARPTPDPRLLIDIAKPVIENINPNIQIIHPIIGIHDKNRPSNASTKPAVAMPFDGRVTNT